MRVPCGLFVVLCFSPVPLGAQSTEDSLAIRLAAIDHEQRGEFSRDTLMLEPDDLELRNPDGRAHAIGMTARSARDRARSEATNRALSEATGLALGSASDAVSCDAGVTRSRNCSIRGGSALVAMSAPEFDADSAIINVRVVKPDRRGGMFVKVTQLTLRKRDGAWVVDRARIMFIT
jgi:hypothetical protein